MTVAGFDWSFARFEAVLNAREKPFSGIRGPQFYLTH